MLHFHVLVTVTSALITQLAKSLLDTKVSARQKQMHVLWLHLHLLIYMSLLLKCHSTLKCQCLKNCKWLAVAQVYYLSTRSTSSAFGSLLRTSTVNMEQILKYQG